jgi:hypothetical protein
MSSLSSGSVSVSIVHVNVIITATMSTGAIFLSKEDGGSSRAILKGLPRADSNEYDGVKFEVVPGTRVRIGRLIGYIGGPPTLKKNENEIRLAEGTQFVLKDIYATITAPKRGQRALLTPDTMFIVPAGVRFWQDKGNEEFLVTSFWQDETVTFVPEIEEVD